MKSCFEGSLRAQITFSMYMEFVWRSDAAFLNGTKIRGVLREQITFSMYMEFVIGHEERLKVVLK